ncbi:MAG: metal-dependent hydrolase [Mycobacterium leprae]
MDNISHAIIGSAVAALLPPGTHAAVVGGVIVAAELPDLDVLIRAWAGELGYLRNHRGPTHGLISLVVEAVVITAVVRVIWPAVPVSQVFVWSLLGGLSHVLSDFGNDYGTQGLWPFSRRRVALDIIPIVDLWILGLFCAAWLLTWRWPGQRQALFLIAWASVAVYVTLRLWLKKRALALVSTHFGVTDGAEEPIVSGPSWPAERVTVQPALLSLRAWHYIVRKGGECLLGTVWVDRRRVGKPVRVRSQMDQAVKASLRSPAVATFADWVRIPHVTVERKEDRYLVRWSDLRYEMEGFSPFTAYAWLDKDLVVMDSGLGSQRPPAMDRKAIARRLRVEMGIEPDERDE